MKPIQKVARSVAQLRRDVKGAIKDINGQAAKKVAQGSYGAAQQLVDLAKAVKQFSKDADSLSDRWMAVRKGQSARSRPETTPVWEYYKLVAHALTARGGEGSLEDIFDWIKKNAVGQLKAGDLADGRKGEPVWQHGLRKARRPMAKEGFIEGGSTSLWKLTKSGKRLAASPDAQSV